MSQEIQEYLTKAKLNEFVYSRQIDLVLNQIIEAAKNFKTEKYIVTDYALRESTIGGIKNLGYKIECTCNTELYPYRYTYKITW